MALLSVASSQLGRSPVKKTPDSVTPGAGDVINGINVLEIRFCSAMTLFSTSSFRCISKALDKTLTNLTLTLVARVAGTSAAGALEAIS